MKLADASTIEQPPELAVPGLKSKVVVHHQTDSGTLGRLDDRGRIFEAWREGFLTEHVHTALGGQRRQHRMGMRRRDEIDEVGAFCVEHGGRIGIGLRMRKLLGDGVRARPVEVAHGDQLRTRHARPGVVVKPAEISGTHGHTSERLPHLFRIQTRGGARRFPPGQAATAAGLQE
jgi:hypothetical protein